MKVYICYYASTDWDENIDIGIQAAFFSKEKAEEFVKSELSRLDEVYLSIEEVEVE